MLPQEVMIADAVAVIGKLALLLQVETPDAESTRSGFLLGFREPILVPRVRRVGVGLSIPFLHQFLVEHLPAHVDIGKEPLASLSAMCEPDNLGGGNRVRRAH